MSTTTVYPSSDGSISVINATWATAHDATTGTLDSSSTTNLVITRLFAAGGGYSIYRFFMVFDTSSIPDTDTITSATLSICGDSKGGTQAWTYNIYDSTCSDTLSAGDFDLVGTTPQCDTAISQSSFNASGYNNFALNATGIGNISKTGYTKFCFTQVANDRGNVAPTTDENIYLFIRSSKYASTTSDPKLVIEHSASSAIKSVNGLAKASVKSINGLAIASVKSWNGLA